MVTTVEVPLFTGSAEKGLLWIKVAADKMPPGKAKLTQAEKLRIRAWLEAGARADNKIARANPKESRDRQVTDADRRFWAFSRRSGPRCRR